MFCSVTSSAIPVPGIMRVPRRNFMVKPGGFGPGFVQKLRRGTRGIAGTLLRIFSSSVRATAKPLGEVGFSVTSVVNPDKKGGQHLAPGYGSKTRRT